MDEDLVSVTTRNKVVCTWRNHTCHFRVFREGESETEPPKNSTLDFNRTIDNFFSLGPLYSECMYAYIYVAFWTWAKENLARESNRVWCGSLISQNSHSTKLQNQESDFIMCFCSSTIKPMRNHPQLCVPSNRKTN